ncbi:MAG: tetratricopeptide repeat protein [Gemmataceae bacterium]
MAPNPYDNCPCGSGKKFKWCCTPYFDKVERALDLQQQGQHEAAVRTMEQAAAEHPTVPQVWGYFAHLHYLEGDIEKAEEVLQKAFELNPNFPMGLLLRGLFRQAEGEVIGALMLFRRAAEAYDPQAHDQLAQVNELIARHEVMLNRPVAARAALERATHFAPADAELKAQFDALFGPESRLPVAARKKYSFRNTVKPVRIDEAATGRLSDAKKAYEQLTTLVPDDPAGWFNLGLVRAWLGEQPAAVQALQTSVEKEWDDAKAEEAAALVEVLRCAQGMEDESDYLEHRIFFPLRDPQAVLQLVQEWLNGRRAIAAQMDQEGGYFSCLLVEELPTLLDTGTAMAKVVANLSISGGVLRLWHPNADGVRKIAAEVRDRVNLAVGEPVEGTGPAQFGDICQEGLAFPVRTANVEEAETKLRERATHFFEEVWANRPLKALAGATPLDAAGSKLLRKRLLGVIRFLDDCLAGAAPRKGRAEASEPIQVYDFNRLRHKLGAEVQPAGEAPAIAVPPEPEPAPAPPPSAPAPAAASPASRPVAAPVKREVSAMSAADLASLPADELSCGELEDAMRSALKLDARELAVRFAKAGVGRPADPAKPDRYPLYACLVAGSQADGDLSAALAHAEAGAKYDAEHNAGKRANEFAVQRGKLLARKGDVDAAVAAFDELLARADDGKFYITATEAMLSAKQGSKATAFAERGLAKARSSGNRDLEGACLELLEAAKRVK